MATWFTAKPCHPTTRSHIDFCPFDSTWEASEAFALETHPAAEAWVKNDHLGFEVHYVFQGTVRKYRPDFLIRLRNGVTLVLEVKGQESDQDRTKRQFLREWIEAVNDHGGFGRWAADVSFRPGGVSGILSKATAPSG